MSPSQKLIAICPECNHETIYNGTALRPRITCRECKTRYYLKTKLTQKPKSQQKEKSIPPQNTSSNIEETLGSIENPVAFTTAHIFKRMVDTGDYRWAQLFVQVLEKTNKLDYETIREEEWLNQAKSMSMKELVEKVAKRESISRSTLRRLDKLGDTSQYESL